MLCIFNKIRGKKKLPDHMKWYLRPLKLCNCGPDFCLQ